MDPNSSPPLDLNLSLGNIDLGSLPEEVRKLQEDAKLDSFLKQALALRKSGIGMLIVFAAPLNCSAFHLFGETILV